MVYDVEVAEENRTAADGVDNSADDEALLKEIRDRYDYAYEKWRKIRDERQIDLRYVCGDPWDATDRKARKDAGRPCVSQDELSQYVNHAVNNARQSKRGIKVDPLTNATEKDSELRQDIIRTAEYRSRAQACYLTAYQSMLEGSYGFFGISRRYVENENLTAENFNQQELWFRPFANADAVLPDPDSKQPDWSDQGYCFVLDPITREEFKRQHPNARITDFSTEHMTQAKNWIMDRMVLRAEYWKVISTQKKQYLYKGQVVEALPKGAKADGERTVTSKRVVQYITNGVEILSTNPQPGTMVPIIPVTGLERYVDEGSGPERKLFSLIRLARDPQMTLAYLASQETEEAGLTPKVPYMGYVGQFETDAEAWENLTKQPVARIQVDPIVDGASGTVLPLPTRVEFSPNFQAYEVAKDGARRAIQAAMGISPLPTAAQRNNEKSGVALEKIEQAQDIGSYHFVDSLDRALMYGGRVANEYIGEIHTEEQEMTLRRPDDTNRHVRLNTKEPYIDEKTGESEHYPIDDGSHTVTVSTGPSSESLRQEVRDFVDTLLGSLKNLPIAPPQAAKVLSIAIKMKGLGPQGDQLADIISPPEQPGQQIPPEAQQAIAQAHQVIQATQAELQKLQMEKAGRVVDNQFKLQIEQMKIEADTAKAEIMTKAQSIEERLKFVEDLWAQLHGQAHEAGMQAQDQAHQQAQQEAAQQHAGELQDSQQQAAAQQQQAAAEQQPEPQGA
ncbi:MAG: hypothetical protein V4502_03545 [Pseudomonadota bacterium]